MSTENKDNLPCAEEGEKDFSARLAEFMKEDKEQVSAPASSLRHTPDTIPAHISNISPLQSLRASVKKTVREGQAEEAERKAEEKAAKHETASVPQPPTADFVTTDPAAEQKLEEKHGKEKHSKEKHLRRPKKTSSLLAKCMPYIYDDQGRSYAEEKPDYTLESVEDIIESAKKRADEKIARMYNLKTSDLQRIGSDSPALPEKEEAKAEEKSHKTDRKPRLRLEETSIKRPLRIGDATVITNNAKYHTVSIPKVSTTLFDDFSGRRTDALGNENVTTPYGESGGLDSTEGGTRIIPKLSEKPDTEQVFEDIMSHTRPAGTVDISSVSKKKTQKPKKTAITDLAEDVEPEVNEFRGREDVNRVGSELKLSIFSSRLRLLFTLLSTLILAALQMMPAFAESLGNTAYTTLSLVCFGVAIIANLNIFTSISSIFSRNATSELPLALAGLLMTAYFIFGIITGEYFCGHALLPAFSLLVYDYCTLRRASAVFGNFRLIASKLPKRALTIIDDAQTTSAMARSAVKGEVLAAGERETDEIDGFLRNTASDRPFAGKMHIFSTVCLIFAALIGAAIGVSLSSLADGLLSAAVILCLGATPSLFVADSLPFAGLCDKLHRLRAGVCSRYSAEKIDQTNAALVDSAELFPAGCIKLFNMKPLSANNLDETITLAAAVSIEANSPLSPMFKAILTDDTIMPEADSVKYEDNLGISGWVGNTHIMIGNRSLMEAHGVKAADLEIDRNILRQGYFPVYVACDQKACALMIVRYEIDEEIEQELTRLSNRGVAILVNNCDPNITEQMLCDYYSLYPDSVKILDHIGADKHRKATAKTEKVFAHAFTRGSAAGFLAILSGCHRVKVLTSVLYVMHIVFSTVLWLLFAGMTLGSSTVAGATLCFMCQLLTLIISTTTYLVGK